MRISHVFVPWIVIATSVGCSDPDRTVGDIYADLSAALCGRIGRCCTATQIACTSGRSLDSEGCQELVRLALREAFYVTDDAVDEGRRRIDQDAAQDCLDQVAELGCYPDPGFLPEPCDEMFPGAAGPGEECRNNDECEAGTRCSNDGVIGVCSPLQIEEEPCFRHEQCGEDLYCSADGYVCRPRAAEGGGCEQDPGVAEAPLCEPGLWCDEDRERCVGPGDVGDDCTPSIGCAEGLVCAVVDNTCMRPKDDGEDCNNPLECESGYCEFDPGPGECAQDPNSCVVGWGLIGVEECTE